MAVTGDKNWAIVPCTFKDTRNFLPASLTFLQKLFTSAGSNLGGLVDYWHASSYGNVLAST